MEASILTRRRVLGALDQWESGLVFWPRTRVFTLLGIFQISVSFQDLTFKRRMQPNEREKKTFRVEKFFREPVVGEFFQNSVFSSFEGK